MTTTQNTYSIINEGLQTDKNDKDFELRLAYLEEMTIEVRCYQRRARFAAKIPSGNNEVKFVLPLIVPAENFFAEPDQAIEAAEAQARKKAWWLDDPEVEYDKNGVPYKEDVYQVCEVLDSVAGEVDQVDVRFRYYPKTVIPQIIYWQKPVGTYRHATTDLMEKIYQDRFSVNHTLGRIRQSLTKRGWDIEFQHLNN